MSYESPIKLIKTLDNEMQMSFDNQIIRAIQKFGIDFSKDELIKALEYDRRQYQKGYEDGKQDATLQWIPVSERLPDDGELVLLTFEGSEKVDMETAIYDVKYGFATTQRWYVEFNEIIAWMPLPEPYKVGENDANV